MIVKSNEFKLNANKPNFIVFEGVNGAGKSTLLGSCKTFLNGNKIKTLETREPGEGEFGKKIREIVLGQTEKKLQPITELFLFAADRTEHVAQTIEPALKNGLTVLCDRYLYSTAAFQGYGRGLNLDFLNAVNNTAIQGRVPDLVVLIDLDPKEGLRRTKSRSGSIDDSFELEELDFHKKLRAGFLEIAKNTKEPFLLLDGMNSPEKLYQELEAVLATLV